MLEEKPKITLENDEKIDEPSPSPLHENEDVEKFKKNEEWYDTQFTNAHDEYEVKRVMNMKSGEQIDQPFPLSSNDDEKAKHFEKIEEEAMVGIPMEFETGLMTLEDKGPKEVSIIEKSI